MLSIFEVDEYAQYEHAVRMAGGGGTFADGLRKFVAYQHYHYGYPFYLLSGLSLLPLRLAAGGQWAEQTQLIVLILRQFVSVLPNLISIWLLTYTATEFRSRVRTIVVFTLLLLLPGLLGNSLWWHPDGAGLLLISLVFFFLRLDRFKFGRFFWLSAIAAGLALGVKFLGALFVLVIPTYLILGTQMATQSLKQATLRAIGFVALMLATFVVSNPVLLFAAERGEFILRQQIILREASEGIFVSQPDFFQDGRLPTWLTENFGTGLFLLLLAISLIIGLYKKDTRTQALLLTAWIFPNLAAVLRASSFRTHYWLPLMMPVITALVFVLPERLNHLARRPLAARKLLQWAALALLLVQAGLFLRQDVRQYTHTLQREDTSPSLQFYRSVQPMLAGEAPVVVYRDWKVYFPNQAGISVFMDWDLASHDMLNSEQPNVLLLERENVEAYGAADYLDSAPDPDRLRGMHLFYRGALLDEIPGYELVYEDGFGLMFVRQ
ncbi:MAG: hypothetical protein KIT08_02135 [Anaerolineales bacterium]|nr:MAG: hypothetical protein KIT08_02135 [Anaerolineales bacterium]